MRNDFEVVVIGGGPLGLWLASELALAKANVIVFEQRAERVISAGATGGEQPFVHFLVAK